jgi:predicted peptidase
MSRACVVALVLAMSSIAGCGIGQPRDTGFLDRSVSIDGSAHRYQVYVPATYRSSVAWPVILFLHGSGESGTDGVAPTKVGLATALRRYPERYPAIVVFPQTPSDKSGHAVTERIALAALDQALGEFNTDAKRVYLTGLSMGGSGTWFLAYRHPERFAALVPVCGWVRFDGESASIVPPGESPFEALANRVRRLPVWIYHGESDTVVPVSESRNAFAALKAAGADVRYTEIAGGNHNAWDAAYQSEDLPAWLFRQSRRGTE